MPASKSCAASDHVFNPDLFIAHSSAMDVLVDLHAYAALCRARRSRWRFDMHCMRSLRMLGLRTLGAFTSLQF
jgi:hypothetical protein